MTSSEQWCVMWQRRDNPADFVSRGMDSLKLKTCANIELKKSFNLVCKPDEAPRIMASGRNRLEIPPS
ncbi:hypothetical protein TNCV_510331 [Trichonephila clavipes]|nr:hypothetical protein TNCV_510331 [Trichonephila clavipes]